MKIRHFVFITMVSMLVTSIWIQAQSPYQYVEKISSSEGLSINLQDVLCDSYGFLWMASNYGLRRFDGVEMKQFFKQNDTLSLPGNIVMRLLAVDSFHIAVATNKGIALLDTRTLTFQKVSLPKDTVWGDYAEEIHFLEKDDHGNFCVVTPVSVYYLDARFNVLHTLHSPYSIDDIGDKRLNYATNFLILKDSLILFALDGKYTIWSTENNTLQIWDGNNELLHALNTLPTSKLFFVKHRYLFCFMNSKRQVMIYDFDTKQTVFQAFEPDNYPDFLEIFDDDSKQTALFCSQGGLRWLKIHQSDTSLSVSIEDSVYLSDYKIKKWYQDADRNIWMITFDKGGLVKVIAQKQHFHTIKLFDASMKKLIAEEANYLLLKDKQWIIGTYGNGLYEIDAITGHSQQFSLGDGERRENMIWNIRQHHEDTLWIGTQNGLFWYHQKSHHSGRLLQPHPDILDYATITTQFTDSYGIVWMGTASEGGMCAYHSDNGQFDYYPKGENSFPFRYPYAIGEDKRGDLWFVSDALAHPGKWDRKKQQFEKVIISEFSKTALSATGGFYLDKTADCFWYGINMMGLVKFDLTTYQTTLYGEDYGLENVFIHGIQKDTKGNLWLNTLQGVFCFNPTTEMIRSFLPKDGLPEIYFPSITQDEATHKIIIGTFGRVVWFYPDSVLQKKAAMKVKLTDIRINNEEIKYYPNRLVRLPWHKNNITVSFTGINLDNGSDNMYSYRLRKEDTTWINIGNQRQINFAGLEPGLYHLIIRGARNGEDWSINMAEFDFEIISPFTKTIWFYLLCLIGVFGITYAWYKGKIIQLLKIETMRVRISRNLHDDIGSRMTNISLMSQIVRKGGLEEDKKMDYLSRIQTESETIVQNMRDIIWSIDPENDSLENTIARLLRFATELLEPKQIELEASINPLKEVKMNMEERHDLLMITKEAVHNIAKHAFAKKVKIIVHTTDKILSLSIIDDGIGGCERKSQQNNGLKNMYNRAEAHHWNLSIISKQNMGTAVQLDIKIT